MRKSKKILILISIIIIIAGIAMMFVKDFNYDIEYSKSTEIKLYTNKEVETASLRAIAKEVFSGEQFVIQQVDYFNDSVAITVKNASDEQIDNLISKTNQAYGLDNTKDTITIIKNGEVKLVDIIKPYIVPTLIALAIIMGYMAIKYREQGIFKVTLMPLAIIALVEMLFFSILAIARLPIGPLTMPIALVILVITLMVTTLKLEEK